MLFRSGSEAVVVMDSVVSTDMVGGAVSEVLGTIVGGVGVLDEAGELVGAEEEGLGEGDCSVD